MKPKTAVPAELLQQSVDPALLGEDFRVLQEADPMLFGDPRRVALDQSVAAERRSARDSLVALVITAGFYAVAHEVDTEFLRSQIGDVIITVPSVVMGVHHVEGLVKSAFRFRRLRRQREDLQFPSRAEGAQS